jgi:1,2-phenylacetyl-CoA epoxidase catalytic subunit
MLGNLYITEKSGGQWADTFRAFLVDSMRFLLELKKYTDGSQRPYL